MKDSENVGFISVKDIIVHSAAFDNESTGCHCFIEFVVIQLKHKGNQA